MYAAGMYGLRRARHNPPLYSGCRGCLVDAADAGLDPIPLFYVILFLKPSRRKMISQVCLVVTVGYSRHSRIRRSWVQSPLEDDNAAA